MALVPEQPGCSCSGLPEGSVLEPWVVGHFVQVAHFRACALVHFHSVEWYEPRESVGQELPRQLVSQSHWLMGYSRADYECLVQFGLLEQL
jgi:hypothetical protein